MELEIIIVDSHFITFSPFFLKLWKEGEFLVTNNSKRGILVQQTIKAILYQNLF